MSSSTHSVGAAASSASARLSPAQSQVSYAGLAAFRDCTATSSARAAVFDHEIPSINPFVIAVMALATSATAQTPPVIGQHPADTFAFTSNRASLSVSAIGDAPLRYQWLFNDGVVQGSTNHSLTITPALESHAGGWRVVVANALGAVTSRVARIAVLPMVTHGPAVPGLEAWDRVLPRLMQQYAVPGGQLAVVRNGRLVLARSYGYADIDSAQPLQPDTLMRIASLSKAITGTAVLRLAEEGKFSIEDAVFSYLGYEAPIYPGSTNDPRLAQVTIKHLLTHTGGWDRDRAVNPNGGIGFDPPFWPDRAGSDLREVGPTDSTRIVKWMLGKPLDFNPGSRYSYSNFGYLVLGRIIEKASGRSYRDYVRELLANVGATRIRMREFGPETGDGRSHQATYYAGQNDSIILSDLEPRLPDVPLPHRWPFPAVDSAGAWSMSAIDYLRFTTGIDGRPQTPDILGSNSLQIIRQQGSITTGGNRYMAGWVVDPNSRQDWWHTGAYFGTHAYCWRRSDGVTFAVIFNSTPKGFSEAVTSTLDQVPGSIPQSRWPTNDLFAATMSYPAWKARHFTAAERGRAEVSGDGADPDSDGRPNLAEYAFHRNPREPEAESDVHLEWVNSDAGTVRGITFRRLLLGHEVDYRVEASSDLTTWSPIVNTVPTTKPDADGSVTAVIIDPDGAATNSARFYRIKILAQAHSLDD